MKVPGETGRHSKRVGAVLLRENRTSDVCSPYSMHKRLVWFSRAQS